MKVIKPRLKRYRKYYYYMIDSIVEKDDYYIILSSHEWKNILKLYDAFLQLFSIIEKISIPYEIELSIRIQQKKGEIETILNRIRLCEQGKIKCNDIEKETLYYTLSIVRKELEYYLKEHNNLVKILDVVRDYTDNEWRMLVCQDNELYSYLREHGINIKCIGSD